MGENRRPLRPLQVSALLAGGASNVPDKQKLIKCNSMAWIKKQAGLESEDSIHAVVFLLI
jgi:hypothetical protein